MIPGIQTGDMFATNSGIWMGKGINFFQSLWSADNRAKYHHAGLLQNEEGKTFEALWTICEKNLFEEYKDKQVLIARCLNVDDQLKQNQLDALKERYLGTWYPFWRLGLHMFPPLARRLHFLDKPVCSELVAKYLWYIGVRHKQWAGTCPDMLVDEWRYWRGIKIIFEGVLTEEIIQEYLKGVGINVAGMGGKNSV
jgi:hypothetical protein